MKEKISIVVVSYNSSKTIIDTLYSIKNQDYGSNNIELIISDDGSNDDTAEKVRSWIEIYGSKFDSVGFLTSDFNQGTTKNLNKAWKDCTCDWVKTIAADDILMDNCISLNIDFKNNEGGNVIVSNGIRFSRVTNESSGYYKNPSDLCGHSASEQFNKLLLRNGIFAPSMFIKLDALKKVGYCDVRYRLVEDYPLWLSLTRADFKINFMDEFTIYYRESDNSLTNNREVICNKDILKDLYNFQRDIIWPELKGYYKMYEFEKRVDFFALSTAILIFNNRSSSLSVLYIKLFNVMKPLTIFRGLKKIFNDCIY